MPKSKDQKRKEAAERQEKYSTLSLTEKTENAGKKVLAKLMSPKKQQEVSTSSENNNSNKQVPLTKEQKDAKKKVHKDALASTKSGTSAVKATPPTEPKEDDDATNQVPKGWDSVGGNE